MRLIQHVRGIEVRGIAVLGINELIEYQKLLIGIDAATIEIVITVFAVIKMKARQFSKLNQARDDHFDIYIRRMMPQVNQRLRFGSQFHRAKHIGTPVLDDG